MRKFAVVLFLLLFILACGGSTKPPVTPPPPAPSEVCGNDICGSGETPRNCPADCEEPEPAPVPEPKPVPVIKRDHSRSVCLGVYSYMASPTVDHEAFFSALPPEINCVEVFGINGWGNDAAFHHIPCDKNTDKCDPKKLNPKYFEFQMALFETAAKYDVKVIWAFGTTYASSGKWGKYPQYGSKTTPFCYEGNRDWCADSKNYYSNWRNKGKFELSDFNWLWWRTLPKPAPDDTIAEVKGVGKNGPHLVMYVRATADNVKLVAAKWKNFKFWWRPFNEEPDGWEEDHRIENWIDKEFKDRGFKYSAAYRVLDNHEAGQHGDDVNDWDLAHIKKNQNWLKARGRIQEIHKCTAAVGLKLLAAGLDADYLHCSSDGVDDRAMDVEADKLLEAKQLKHVGIKPNDYAISPTGATKDRNFNYRKINEWAKKVLK